MNKILYPFGPIILETQIPEEICNQVIDWTNSQQEKDPMASFQLAGQLEQEVGLPIFDFPELKELLESKTREYIEMCFDNNRPGQVPKDLSVKFAWVNKMIKGDWNPMHIHGGDFSGIIYLSDFVPVSRDPEYSNKKPGGATYFIDGRATPWGAHEHTIQPQKGKMLIFPSWLSHMVGPSWNEQERYTMSWNI